MFNEIILNKQIHTNRKQGIKRNKNTFSNKMDSVAMKNAHGFFSESLDVLMKMGFTFNKDGEEVTKEQLMKVAWGDYEPGSELAKPKKVACKPKKPRALSGYTYFGQQNKVKFNEEMDKMEEKPKFVSYVGEKWKELTEEEREEWGNKAKAAFEKNQE